MNTAKHAHLDNVQYISLTNIITDKPTFKPRLICFKIQAGILKIFSFMFPFPSFHSLQSIHTLCMTYTSYR